MHCIACFLICLIASAGFAQIKRVPIYRDPSQTGNLNARTQGSLPPKSLPFWDDFSVLNPNPGDVYYPLNTQWENSHTVWVNSGTGINPPSLNVATFDGYDSLGKPYSVNNVLAKGFADKMTSGALKLADVAIAQRSSVFLSFFYQFTGNGDPPEQGDAFSLFFKNESGQWKQVWTIENNGLLKPDVFVQVIIPINASEYFHNGFQFRFQNFGRLSGPFDTWNLDYVYLNAGRNSTDLSYPDRSITSPLTLLFKQYRSIPLKHFKNDSLFIKPSFNAYNLRVGNDQPLNHFCSSTTLSYKAKTLTKSLKVLLDSAVSDGSLTGGQKGVFSLSKLPKHAWFDSNADSVAIRLAIILSTKDNQLITNNGDYDPAIYSPINFVVNDTISSTFSLGSYYAYDDGIAEYGASIDGNGTQLAYQFDLKTNKSDTIKAIDIFFPKFGDDTNQTVQLHVLGGLTGNPIDYLFQQNITVQRTNKNSKNVFTRIPIPTGVIVKGTFYIGWKLNSSAQIPVGLDANTESGDKIFVNSTGTWIQNKTLKGSLMIRPLFGKPQPIMVAVADAPLVKPYPNPTQQKFYLPASAQQIRLFDINGKEIVMEADHQFERTEISIVQPSPGLYLVRYFDGTWRTEKIMVQP